MTHFAGLVLIFMFLFSSFIKAQDATISPDEDPEIISYSESEEVAVMIKNALKNKLVSGMENSLGKCSEYVRKALNSAGMSAWTGATAHYAYQVKDAALKLGYNNLLEKYPDMKSKEAPKGAILVYSGKPTLGCVTPEGFGCGHVEIKTEEGYSGNNKKIYYVSDYSDYRPADISSRFKLTAILIKINN